MADTSLLVPPMCAVVAGCSAEVCTLPVELTKVRMQVSQASPVQIIRSVLQTQGFSGLWTGLRPALARQVVCSATKFAVYEPYKRATYALANKPITEKPQLWQLLVAGGAAGATMGFVGNPADLVKTRMQSGHITCESTAKDYSTILGAFSNIVRNEGFAALWRGVVPMVQRSVLVTMAELAVYDKSKNIISEKGLLPAGAPTHAASSFAAGFVAAAVATPVDLAKNRLMTDSLNKPENRLYSGMFDVLRKTARSEGYSAFYRGFFPTWMRIGPWAVIMFMTYEQLMSIAGASTR